MSLENKGNTRKSERFHRTLDSNVDLHILECERPLE